MASPAVSLINVLKLLLEHNSDLIEQCIIYLADICIKMLRSYNNLIDSVGCNLTENKITYPSSEYVLHIFS